MSVPLGEGDMAEAHRSFTHLPQQRPLWHETALSLLADECQDQKTKAPQDLDT